MADLTKDLLEVCKRHNLGAMAIAAVTCDGDMTGTKGQFVITTKTVAAVTEPLVVGLAEAIHAEFEKVIPLISARPVIKLDETQRN